MHSPAAALDRSFPGWLDVPDAVGADGASVPLRMARIKEQLAELQEMVHSNVQRMDAQQQEAASEIARLRERLLDSLTPAALRRADRLAKLAGRLEVLERGVGQEQAEVVRVMEAVLSTVEKNGAAANTMCQRLSGGRSPAAAVASTAAALAMGSLHSWQREAPAAASLAPVVLPAAVQPSQPGQVEGVLEALQADSLAATEAVARKVSELTAAYAASDGETGAQMLPNARGVPRHLGTSGSSFPAFAMGLVATPYSSSALPFKAEDGPSQPAELKDVDDASESSDADSFAGVRKDRKEPELKPALALKPREESGGEISEADSFEGREVRPAAKAAVTQPKALAPKVVRPPVAESSGRPAAAAATAAALTVSSLSAASAAGATGGSSAPQVTRCLTSSEDASSSSEDD
ncbi:unnamed protein product [Polarella glacialis]|uniref:Mediator of RNA polymerase II transcription subunit 4 n=1 Tax=Polarella glacialis TaxID=89957 RepID=A0A813DW88_POLGL|nr:unnamed protein product [Polarella glacialis]